MNKNRTSGMVGEGKEKMRIVLILGFLTAYVPFSIDTYLPAMTRIADYFGTTSANMTFSLTAFFVGFAAGQIVYGPLLDRFGRKTPLYYGLIISILANIGCILSWDAGSFIVFRFIQALGASVASVSALAMVRDFFPPEESSRIFSMLVLVIGSSPLLAPTIGGYITAHVAWQWIFVFLSLMAVTLIYLVVFVLPVNYLPDKKSSMKIPVLVKNYWTILTKPQFITFALSGAFSFASLFIYVAGSPIIFMEQYNMSPQSFGIVFAMLSIGFIGGSQLNILALKKFKSRHIFRFALVNQLTIAILFYVGMLNGWYGRNTIIVFLFLILLCLGFTSPNGIALSLAPIRERLGSASALLGTIRIGIAGLSSGGIALLNVSDGIPVAGMMVGTTFIAVSIFLVGKQHIRIVPASK